MVAIRRPTFCVICNLQNCSGFVRLSKSRNKFLRFLSSKLSSAWVYPLQDSHTPGYRVMVLSWMNEGNVQRIFSLAVLRTLYHSILPAWYRAAAASVSKARGCSQKFWGEFFSYNLHQSINSLDIQRSRFSFEGYSKILSWRVNKKRMGKRWSW